MGVQTSMNTAPAGPMLESAVKTRGTCWSDANTAVTCVTRVSDMFILTEWEGKYFARQDKYLPSGPTLVSQ